MGKNTFKLEVMGQTKTLDLVVMPNITDSFWLNLKDEEIPVDDKGVQDIFYGEEVKIKLLTAGASDGTEFLITVKALDSSVELEEYERQPLSISVTASGDEAVSESFYIHPTWFDKENSVTYVFDVSLKEDDAIIAENFPEDTAKHLTPVGFGKPDKFQVDGAKAYLLERKSDGTKVASTSGDMEDIEMYQSWFEDDSDELDLKKKVQIQTYFDSVYMTRLFRWSPKDEYGNAANRSKIIAAFEKAATKHSVPASVLMTYAAGEGMQAICSRGSLTDLDRPVQSYQAFGLDFFEEQAAVLKAEGYLSPTFSTKVTAAAEKFLSGGKEHQIVNFPKDFKGQEYAIVRYADGSKFTRHEAADKKRREVSPVVFKDLLTGIEGACAVYAKAYKDAQTSSRNIGWGELTLNQKVFFTYFKVQNTSTLGNAEINKFRTKTDANFYDRKYSNLQKVKLKAILEKCYRRYVAWRYILLGKYFIE